LTAQGGLSDLNDAADLSTCYGYERRVLKLLQWGFPARPWRLKTPAHLLFLDHLDQVFPDARFVWTHRDPTAVIISVADLCVEVSRRFCDDIDSGVRYRWDGEETYGMLERSTPRDQIEQ
jgi:hypothetical protein